MTNVTNTKNGPVAQYLSGLCLSHPIVTNCDKRVKHKRIMQTMSGFVTVCPGLSRWGVTVKSQYLSGLLKFVTFVTVFVKVENQDYEWSNNMDNYFLKSVIQDINGLRYEGGHVYTDDQIIEIIKIAELRKIVNELVSINRNTVELRDIERSVDRLANDADDLTEAVVREGQGYVGGPFKYASVKVNMD